MIAAALTMVLALAAPAITIQQNVRAGSAPQENRLVSLHLGEAEERALRELFVAAREREEREEREAKRDGQVTGGVWGFVSYSYRVTFEGKPFWLHTAADAAWLDGDDEENISFTRPESARLEKILRRIGPSPMTVVWRLPMKVTWTPAAAVDLNCDSVDDIVFTARDAERYYVGAVMAPVRDSSVPAYVAFRLAGNSQDAFCGEPAKLQEETLDGTSCKGLRLDSGECDAFHIYWNQDEQQLDWSRL
jgi:hypothetical protein